LKIHDEVDSLPFEKKNYLHDPKHETETVTLKMARDNITCRQFFRKNHKKRKGKNDV